MKRFLVPILVFIYIGTASGFNINAHYCMERLVEANLFAHQDNDNDVCSYCGMTDGQGGTKSCCSKKLTEVKTKSHQQGQDLLLKWNTFSMVVLPSFSPEYIALSPIDEEHKLPVAHAPPSKATRPLFLKHESFLI